MIVLQIISRQFGITTTSWTDEVLQFFMMYFVFIGSASLVESKGHVQLDIIPNSSKGVFRKVLNIGIQLCVIAASSGFLYGGYLWVQKTATITPFLSISWKYYYVAIPISGALMIFFALCIIIDILRGRTAASQTNQKE